jgi:hypothetical protein
LKNILFYLSRIGSIVLVFLAVSYCLNSDLALAQASKQNQTKDSREQKGSSFGFEDDQSAMCLSATRQAKLVASFLETYSRRLGACATSSPNFRDDCSVEFARLAKGYNDYQFAISSVRNYCN